MQRKTNEKQEQKKLEEQDSQVVLSRPIEELMKELQASVNSSEQE